MKLKSVALLSLIAPLAISQIGCPSKGDPVPNEDIEVLIVVTPEADAEISLSYGDTTTYAEYVLQYANSAALDSGANLNFQVADVYETTEVEATIMPNQRIGQAFDWLLAEMLDSTSNIYLERTNSDADVVVILTTDTTGDKSGNGRITAGDTDRDYKRARAAVEWYRPLSIIHELGHLLGMQHDEYQLASKGLSTSGYENGMALPTKGARSIMAYEKECEDETPSVDCQRVPLFTNPDVAVNGQIMGSSGEFNACVIEERKSYLASFDKYLSGAETRPNNPLSSDCPWTLSVGETYCSGGTFTTNSELADLAPCTVIIDDITLNGTGITSTSSLASIHTIKGDFTLTGTGLSNLSGLSNLETVRGNLTLSGSSISDLSGLTSLSSIEETITIDSTSLVSLVGLEGLTAINSIKISSNSDLYSLTGLDNLTAVHGEMNILWNPSLDSCDGLENLVYIQTGLSIIDNDVLTSVEALDGLYFIDDDYLIVRLNSMLDSCDFANLTIADVPNVTIHSNGSGCFIP